MKALVCFLIAAAAVMCAESDEVQAVEAAEGASVTLRTCFTTFNPAAELKWGFGTPVALIAWKGNKMSLVNFDKRFKGRLQLDTQTGRLTISNITVIHSGLYTLLSNNTDVHRRFTLTVHAPGSVPAVGNFSAVSECPTPDEVLSVVSPAQASDVSSVHCCGPVEAVIRVVFSTSVTLVAVFILNYHFQ